MEAHAQSTPSAPTGDPALPPVQQISIAVIVLVVIGGIDIASYLPRHAPQGPILGLLAAAAALLALNAVLLSRVSAFNWRVFRQVAGWVLLAYLVIAGMLEYVFVFDDTSGSQLVILTAMLAVFMLNVPLLIGFCVARFQAPEL